MDQQPSPFELAVQFSAGLVGVLFWSALTFVMGVVAWALLGPSEAIALFVILALLFVVFPTYVAHRARARWSCPRCSGIFRAGLSNCPHCGMAVVPPSH